jgi:ABC-type dipeptide/oligopeptide/nickel transport system ATPase component
LPAGCALAPRCPYVVDHCREAVPPLDAVDVTDAAVVHRSACFRSGELEQLVVEEAHAT